MVSEMELRINDLLSSNPEMLAKVKRQQMEEEHMECFQECIETLRGIMMDIDYAQGLYADLKLNKRSPTYQRLNEAYDLIKQSTKELDIHLNNEKILRSMDIKPKRNIKNRRK